MDPDELAGVVDLFGGLTREQLEGALADLAARSGDALDDGELASALDRAVEGYYLVPVEAGAEAETESEADELLVAGPSSLPTLPHGGEDLPHLVDADVRTVDREAAGRAALSRLHGDAARAVDDGDEERVAALLDVCYDLEAWAPVDTAELRERLDAAV